MIHLNNTIQNNINNSTIQCNSKQYKQNNTMFCIFELWCILPIQIILQPTNTYQVNISLRVYFYCIHRQPTKDTSNTALKVKLAYTYSNVIMSHLSKRLAKLYELP